MLDEFDNLPPDTHGVIYGLIDPRTNELRYVGQTVNMCDRLAVHTAPSSLKKRSYLASWIKNVMKDGLKPLPVLRAVAKSQTELDELEIAHIAECRQQEFRLVNMSDGGGGRAGYVTPQETKDKIAAAQIGVPKPKHSEEWKQRMSETKKGVNTNTPEHMAKLHDLRRGTTHSEETKRKISESRKGKYTGPRPPEVGQKVSAAQRGRKGISGQFHGGYRSDISTDDIKALIASGLTKAAVARKLSISRTFINRRLKQRDNAEIYR